MKVFLISLAVQVLLFFITRVMIHSMTDVEVINMQYNGRYPYRVCLMSLLWALSVLECIVSFIVWMVNL